VGGRSEIGVVVWCNEKLVGGLGGGKVVGDGGSVEDETGEFKGQAERLTQGGWYHPESGLVPGRTTVSLVVRPGTEPASNISRNS